MSKKLSIKTVLFLFAFLPMLAPMHGAFAFTDQIFDLTTYPTHSRLKIQIDTSVDVKLTNHKDHFELFIKSIDLVDLGAPFGSEQAWMNRFNQLGDYRLQRVELNQNKDGVLVKGYWKYPTGKLALLAPKMEIFEFREANPGNYVIDFWVKKGITVVEHKKKIARDIERKRIAEEKRKKEEVPERRLAFLKEAPEADNVSDYCEETLNEKSDTFISFKPSHDQVNFDKWFSYTTADRDYVYYKPVEDTKEAQYVRLALALREKGKPALAIRTIDFLNKEFPKSKYSLEMKFLKANLLRRLGHDEEFKTILKELVTEAQKLPIALHSGVYLATELYRDGFYLQALERFLWLSQNYTDHRLRWVFHLGSAESLYKLKQTQKAAKEYQWIVENALDKKVQATAALTIGDLYLERKQYEQALASYFKALRMFEEESLEIPKIYLNRGETLYWLGQYDRAEKVFNEYIEKFPTDPSGWRATFRLGEISGRKEKNSSDFRKWMYQTINNYPLSAGATLARLRLIPCGDFGKFDISSAKRFFEKSADQFDSREEIDMSEYPDFLKLTKVRAYTSLGDEDAALAIASDSLQKKLSENVRVSIGRTFKKVFRKRILALLEKDKNYGALAVYYKYSDVLPKDGENLPSYFILRLSQAASDLHLGSVANQLVAKYKSLENLDTRNIASQGELKNEQKALLNSEIAFTQAKALWIEKGMKSENEIKDILGKITEESVLSVEKNILLTTLSEKNKKYDFALEYLDKAEKLFLEIDKKNPDYNPIGKVQLRYWKYRLNQSLKNYDLAMASLEEILKGYQDKRDLASLVEEHDEFSVLGAPHLPSQDEVLLKKAEVLEKQKKWAQASVVYEQFVKDDLKNLRVMFSYAKTLNKTGTKENLLKSNEILKKIIAIKDGDQFWKNLAGQALTTQNFNHGG